jgi:hypothetical protein
MDRGGPGFAELLWTVESNVRYLRRTGAKPDLVRMWENLLSFLRRLPEKDVHQIEGVGVAPGRARPDAALAGPSDAEIAAMTIEAIEEILLKDLPRRELERLAKIRFNLTPGDLSNLSNRDALAEKIRSMCDNEGTHSAIERVAGKR